MISTYSLHISQYIHEGKEITILADVYNKYMLWM